MNKIILKFNLNNCIISNPEKQLEVGVYLINFHPFAQSHKIRNQNNSIALLVIPKYTNKYQHRNNTLIHNPHLECVELAVILFGNTELDINNLLNHTPGSLLFLIHSSLLFLVNFRICYSFVLLLLDFVRNILDNGTLIYCGISFLIKLVLFL